MGLGDEKSMLYNNATNEMIHQIVPKVELYPEKVFSVYKMQLEGLLSHKLLPEN